MNETVKKRSSKADATVQKILEASLERIKEQGESGLSITDICQDIGISRPTIYRYFPTREALLEGVFELIIDDYMEKLENRIATADNPLQLVDTIADFAQARLQDGGPQIFQLDPSLVVKLIARSHDRLIEHGKTIFGPLFDMKEALTGREVDRESAATAYLLFSLSLSFFGKQSSSIKENDLFRKMIRVLPHFE